MVSLMSLDYRLIDMYSVGLLMHLAISYEKLLFSDWQIQGNCIQIHCL